MLGNMSERGTTSGTIPTTSPSEDFISNCLQVLDSTTPGTVIYILTCLCPEDFAVILDLLHFDLSQPHHHKYLSEKRVHVASNTYAAVISNLQAYTNTLPRQVYCDLWLEVAQRWLLTCPIDPEYYLEDETGKELYCQRLRSELIERILNIN